MILCHNCSKLLEVASKKIPHDFFSEVFVTDDGSTDNSVLIAKNLGYKVIYSTKTGYGANVKNGLKYAFDNGADYVVEIHGDGAQFDPKAVYAAKKYITKNYDFIIGSRLINISRTLELKIPYPRLLANICLSFIDKIVLRLPFSEFHTGFRIYGKAFKKFNFSQTSDDYLFSFEIIAQAAFKGLKCSEVPVECDYISDHTSHSYKGASLYALKHFGVLYDYILSKKLKKLRGVFNDL